MSWLETTMKATSQYFAAKWRPRSDPPAFMKGGRGDWTGFGRS